MRAFAAVAMLALLLRGSILQAQETRSTRAAGPRISCNRHHLEIGRVREHNGLDLAEAFEITNVGTSTLSIDRVAVDHSWMLAKADKRGLEPLDRLGFRSRSPKRRSPSPIASATPSSSGPSALRGPSPSSRTIP
jgi:hypothetical protein